MKLIKIAFLIALFAVFSCKKVDEPKKEPKNVILLIADGTGITQISTAFYFKETAPNYGRFENIGLINTSSDSHEITDSAAGATAFSAGIRTYNGAVGVAPDSSKVKNIVEIISPLNIKSGLVATSSITHATPACFYAHVIKRSMEEDIAVDMVASEVDYFAGGGLKFFNKRNDGRNLVEELRAIEFIVDTVSLKSFEDIKESKKAAFLLANGAMPKITENRGSFLSDATELGIEFLTKDNSNFFMMVEGSQVDWGGHANEGNYVVTELIDFDEAVGKALDFAEKDGNTLVIVTGDHETGGLALSSTKKENSLGVEYNDYDDINLTFSTGGHSATLIPVFSYGPGSEVFKGVYNNNDIYKKILEVTGWK